MKKATVLTALLLIVLTALPPSCVATSKMMTADNLAYVDANGLCGGKSPCFLTIQSAVDYIPPGGSIYIFSGMYYENVFVYKPLGIKGQERSSVVVSGTDYISTAIRISSSNVAVSNLTIEDTQVGLAAEGADSVTVRDVTVFDDLAYWRSASIGVLFRHTSYSTISGNNISHKDLGIRLEDRSSHVEISHNEVSRCNHGIFAFTESNDNDIHHNLVFSDGYSGIMVQGTIDRWTERNTIRYNVIRNSFVGIYSGYASFYNQIFENDVRAPDVPQSVVSTTLGLMMFTTFDNSIWNNTFSDVYYGMGMNWGRRGRFEGNRVRNCGGVGIALWQSSYNRFMRNSVKDCRIAVEMVEVGGYLVTDWNVFHHNNFIRFEEGARPIFRNNVWDDGRGEGNYWSDYEGVDDGSGVGRFGEPRIAGDGIGDTNIPHWQVDWYPFMNEIGPEVVQGDVDIDPDTLNLRSIGRWVTAYIELPDPYNVSEISLGTVVLGGKIPAEADEKYGFVSDPQSYIVDHDGDGVLDRMLKFDRLQVVDLVSEMIENGNYNETDGRIFVELQVRGSLKDGTRFECSDTVRIILHKALIQRSPTGFRLLPRYR